MKSLFLIRHAKSSWKDTSLRDFDRPLNNRGKKDAPMMGQKLIDMGMPAPYLVSSPALRAKSTALAFAQAYNISPNNIAYRSELYESDAEDLLQLIRQTPAQTNSLMLFGHNPEFTTLGNRLGNLNIYNIPTTGILALSFTVDDWSDLEFGDAHLKFFIYPKLFKKEKQP